ncbi:MAG: glycosyltransferase [Alphaproteobacteria bacterium]|nr:glycosyltransferase [Alphaproteobacteria bacterium]
MTKQPKVSIVVPIYGVEKYLNQCVDSILAQTLTDIEIILVDDGSPDKCPQIVDEYAKRDKRVVAVHQPNGGYGVAVNHGIELARGEYVGIIESDDWIEPTMYEKLYNNAVKNNSDVVKCSFYVYNSLAQKEKNINRKWKLHYMNLFNAPDGAFTLADFPQIVAFHASVWAALYRADFIKDIKMGETKSASYQDFPFMCEVMSRAKRISVEKDYLVHYRMEEGQGSSTIRRDARLIMMATQSIAGIDVLRKNGVLDLVKEEIYYHVYLANFWFFRIIMWQYKSQYFDELYKVFAPLQKDYSFKWKYFSRTDQLFCACIMANDMVGATRYRYPLTLANIRRFLISIRTPSADYFVGWRVQIFGIQIGSHLDYYLPAFIRIKM